MLVAAINGGSVINLSRKGHRHSSHPLWHRVRTYFTVVAGDLTSRTFIAGCSHDRQAPSHSQIKAMSICGTEIGWDKVKSPDALLRVYEVYAFGI